MATIESNPNPSEPAAGKQGVAHRFTAWVDRTTLRISEVLNPILVKEARQSLKSRQFTVPFLLVLVACWIWSLWAVSISDNVYYGAVGWEFFMGYYAILAFPLIVIVPFGTYRSLTAEREDGTFELLSITTLRPAQIVNGKLASAIMQMTVYLSAVAPCVAFTYLLRGIDLFMILALLFWLVSGSLLLCVLTLMLATLATARQWQIMMNVFVIAGLVLSFFGAVNIVGEVIYGASIGQFGSTSEFWEASFASFTGDCGVMALAYAVAVAQLKFAADNRSTAVRIVMLVNALLFVSWIAWFCWKYSEEGMFLVELTTVAAILHSAFWAVMGAFLIGETSELSRRVRRKLPGSFLGRMVSAWLIPGSGTGYMFAICATVAGSVFTVVTLAIVDLNVALSPFAFRPGAVMLAMTIIPLYVIAYLGVGRLLVLFFRRYVVIGPPGAFLLVLVTLGVASLLPLALEAIARGNQMGDEASMFLQIANPFYVLVNILNPTPMVSGGAKFVACGLVGIAALLIFLANLPSLIREIRQQRLAVPKRVEEETAKREPPPQPLDSYVSPFAES